MDPITLIVTALATGASGGALDALKDDVKDAPKAAYTKLRGLAKKRFQGNAAAEVILAEHESDPETYNAALAKKLTEADAGGDADLVGAAEAFMKLVDQAGARSAKYDVKVDNSQGVQVGDGNFQFNRFGSS